MTNNQQPHLEAPKSEPVQSVSDQAAEIIDEPVALGDTHILGRDETKEILTPFAFEIDKTLFGLPLAKPWKRGAALLIDLMLIAILSSAPGELLAIVIAITAYRLGSKKRAEKLGKQRGGKRRALSRAIGAFILFVVLLDVLPQLFGQFEPDTPQTVSGISGEDLDVKTTLKIASIVTQAITITKNSQCTDVTCWRSALSGIVNDLAWLKHEKGVDDIADSFDEFVSETNLDQVQQQALSQALQADFEQALAVLGGKGSSENEQAVVDTNDTIAVNETHPLGDSITEQVTDAIDASQPAERVSEDKPVYSILKLIEGIIEDLGLGFGWAAFYFTVFTALWQGQTPGKRLFAIKVIQLDGTPLSMWDSFGRYGGYGAGIATGLLGFLQIYWDANRQAIHDKISATVVIDK